MTSPLRPLLLTFVILNSSAVTLRAAPPPELTVLRQQYDKVITERVTAPFDASLASLNTKFIAALSNAVTTAKQAGKLDDVLAIQDDLKRLTEKIPIPDDTDTTPEALKTLRAIYRGQLAKLEEARTANHRALLPAYTAKLTELEATLVKNDRIDEAKELRTYREGLAQSGPASPVNSPPSTPGTAPATPPVTPPVTASTNNAPKVKGDDRKAAEWLLKVGGHFEIDERGKKSSPKSPEDLPKGKFSIISINLDGRDTKEAINAEGLQNLTGLPEVKIFLTGQLPLTDSDLAFVATLPALEKVSFSRETKITDAIVDSLVPLKRLSSINASDTREFTCATLDRLAGCPELKGLDFTNTGLNAAGAAAIAKLKNIFSITAENCQQLDNEALRNLALCPSLRRLRICDTSTTAEGLVAAKLQIDHLDCNRLSGKPLAETVPIIGPAYPGIISLRLARSEQLTRQDIEALAHFKKLRSITFLAVNDTTAWAGLVAIPSLEDLTFDRNPFGDAEVDHLLKVPSLKAVSFMAVDVTDAGLLKLAALKKLKSITLRPCPKVTDAGLAALKKQRPDIQISR